MYNNTSPIDDATGFVNMVLPFLLPLIFASFVCSKPELDEPMKCIIIQGMQRLKLPKVPDFLQNNKDYCQQSAKEDQSKQRQEALQCGNSNVYIKPECVCTFHNVWEAGFHEHTACPNGEKSDLVLKLRCSGCYKYSLNNKGPCINGGNLSCKEDVLAPEIQCDCPSGYSGMFCENEILKVTRICDRIEEDVDLPNCDITKMECITYSESKLYVFKCNKTVSKQEKEGVPITTDLPLCSETETMAKKHTPSTVRTTFLSIENDPIPVKGQLTSRANGVLFSLSIVIASQALYFML